MAEEVKKKKKGFSNGKQSLPPKGPWITGIQETGNFSGWSNHHHSSSSLIGSVNGNTSFNDDDEFIIDEGGPSKSQSYHRRCASDSLAFLDDSNHILEFGASLPPNQCRDSDGIDEEEEQLFSMFADIEPFHHRKETETTVVGQIPIISDNPSTPSDHYSVSEITRIKNENEVQSCEMDSTTELAPSPSSNVDPIQALSIDSNIDPKRVKRILANRQSAQRSRVRKLQYIAELERSVNGLQGEVSSLSPQVAYLDHQRLLLTVDNSSMKQRIAALAQEKIFKDAHCEHLKKEAATLRQIYQQQYLHKDQQQQQSPAFETRDQKQQQQANGNAKLESSNGGQQQMVKPSSCLIGESNKNFDERMLIATYPSDYMVQNP